MPGTDKRLGPEPDTASVIDRDSESDIASLTAIELLSRLKMLSVELRVKDGKLLLNAPVGALTAELQSELRRRKLELLAALESTSSLVEERIAPLTYAQQRLWLIEKFTPGSVAYNIPQSWIVDGAVDLNALRQAIQKLTERHAALRTSIEVRNGEVLQVVKKSVETLFEVTDLTAQAGAGTNESQLMEIHVREGRRPFKLDCAPLIRFHLVKLRHDRHVISYNIHHIVADQWSLTLIKRDLAAFYIQLISGLHNELPAITMEYADVAIRERNDSATRLHESQLAYWRERLKGMPTLLELPFIKTRPAEQSYHGETLSATLNSDLTNRLRQLAARSNTSLYLLMLSAFAALLYRYTGQTDLCIGTPITGRRLREEELLVGLFVNMLPLRCDVDPKKGFDQLLQRIGAAVLSDFDHSDIPFQKLVTELHPQRSQAYSPFFQITFALNPKGAGVDKGHRETFIGTSKFDLSLQIAEQQETLDAHFEFRTDIFSRADVERFSKQFVQLTESLVASPRQEIGSLEMLTEDDRDLLLQWNATDLSFDRSKNLVDLFEEQVKLRADASALCCGGKSYTFLELHERVIRTATVLRARGVKRGTYVAVCLERSPELIVSILAVLKTGAAYVPLDPKYPEERLAYMLLDSGARVLIAERSALSERLEINSPGLTLVFPDEIPRAVKNEVDQPASFLDPAHLEDAAYLIYTSGSTGKPKGVVVEHRNAVALLAWAKNCFAPESLRGVLASTSVCFDLSIFEIFVPLSTGNTIVLVKDVLDLPRSEHSNIVTLINTVPSAMSALLQVGLPATVNTVCMAGELLPQELVERVYATGVRQVFDLYGPTETTTYSTFALREPAAVATIGCPISNTRIYLLDENLSLVPPGAAGEIFIGGEGVAQGYLYQPELTNERFLQLPAIEPRGRLYRTGDLARQRNDGSLVYLGRRDQQIKLRGHRIELGEIEAVLREASGSSQVAVVVQKVESGHVLVGFVAGVSSAENDPQTWITALRKRLPTYMVPARIIPLAALPLTPNGKIDRKALSEPIETGVAMVSEVPRDLLEQWVANIWELKLGQEQIARDAHFFEDLGGHSLAAFEIFAEIERRLGIAMLLATLFQAPTIALLASAIRLKKWTILRYVQFIASGNSEKVIYIVGEPSNAQLEGVRSYEERVMAVGLEKSSRKVDAWAQEIAAFEANRPSLLLVADESDLEITQRLAASLSQLGFAEISHGIRKH